MPTARITRPALNFDAPEPVVTTDSNASGLFPSQPIYARTPAKKSSGNLPLLIGVPVVVVAAGALLWGMTANRGDAPTDPKSMQTAVADTPAPKTAPVPSNVAATPAPIPQPTEVAANEAPAPVARSAAPRAAAPARPAARRAAPVDTTPDASSASANVSATVPAAPPTVSAPAIAEPAPLVIPAPAAPAPATTEPSAPM
jgi:hypothetical protein